LDVTVEVRERSHTRFPYTKAGFDGEKPRCALRLVIRAVASDGVMKVLSLHLLCWMKSAAASKRHFSQAFVIE